MKGVIYDSSEHELKNGRFTPPLSRTGRRMVFQSRGLNLRGSAKYLKSIIPKSPKIDILAVSRILKKIIGAWR